MHLSFKSCCCHLWTQTWTFMSSAPSLTLFFLSSSCQLSMPIIVHMCNLLCVCVTIMSHVWMTCCKSFHVVKLGLFRFAKQFVLLRPMSVVAGAESSSFGHGLCCCLKKKRKKKEQKQKCFFVCFCFKWLMYLCDIVCGDVCTLWDVLVWHCVRWCMYSVAYCGLFLFLSLFPGRLTKRQ